MTSETTIANIFEIYDLCMEIYNYCNLYDIRVIRLVSKITANRFEDFLIDAKVKFLINNNIEPYNVASYLGNKFCYDLIKYHKNNIYRSYGLTYSEVATLHNLPKLLSPYRYNQYMSNKLIESYTKILNDPSYKNIINYKYLQKVDISDYQNNLIKCGDIKLAKHLFSSTKYTSLFKTESYSNRKIYVYKWNEMILLNYDEFVDIIDKKFVYYPLKFFAVSFDKNIFTNKLIFDILSMKSEYDVIRMIHNIEQLSMYQKVLDVICNNKNIFNELAKSILNTNNLPINKKIIKWIYKNHSSYGALTELLPKNTFDILTKIFNNEETIECNDYHYSKYYFDTDFFRLFNYERCLINNCIVYKKNKFTDKNYFKDENKDKLFYY